MVRTESNGGGGLAKGAVLGIQKHGVRSDAVSCGPMRSDAVWNGCCSVLRASAGSALWAVDRPGNNISQPTLRAEPSLIRLIKAISSHVCTFARLSQWRLLGTYALGYRYTVADKAHGCSIEVGSQHRAWRAAGGGRERGVRGACACRRRPC